MIHILRVFCVMLYTHPCAGLPTQDPYWAELWASAIAIAQIVAEDNILVRGQRIADVGCGLGVAGLVAAIHGVLLAHPNSP